MKLRTEVKINTVEIQQWGENKYMSEEMKNSQLNEADHFIAIEVLQYLEFINMNLTIKDDIPYILTSVRSFIIAIIDDIMAIRKLITNRYDTRNSNNINIL